MKLIKQIDLLLHPISNIEEVACLLVKEHNLKVNTRRLSSKIRKHPNNYSFLALHDVLSDYGIETKGIKCENAEFLKSIKNDFIVQIKLLETKQDFFAYVYNLNSQTCDWFNPIKHKREKIDIENFKQIFTGYLFLFDLSDDAGEKKYKEAHSEEVKQRIIENILFFFLPLFFILVILSHAITSPVAWIEYIYAFLLLTGCIVGGILLLHEYNEYNPILSHLCVQSEKFNCSAVLFSKGSQFMGIPWTVIGFSYFLGIFMSLLIYQFDSSIFITITYCHLFVLPYVLYSLYYQKKVVKQWCSLCLTVQILIILLFTIALIGGAYTQIKELTIRSFLGLFGIMFLSSTLTYFLWLFIKYKKSSDYFESSFIQIKYNPMVFQSLLEQEEKIIMPVDNYGITMGKKNGKYQIIKVCNPYCSHCADAQNELQKLMNDNGEIGLRIIFINDPDTESYKQTPIDAFLSFYYEGCDMEPILSEWYDSEEKNIDFFNQRHPLKEHFITKNMDNAKAMCHFCDEMKITGTPTLFINGYRLPDVYHVDDLKYLLNKI